MDVFTENILKGLLSKRTETDFRIELKEDAKSIKKGPNHMSDTKLAEIKKQVEYLIGMRFVRPIESPVASPVLYANKTDGKLRFCFDYRTLNKFNVEDSYPLPQIDCLMDRVGNAKYLKTADLRRSYHQMRSAEEHISKKAFSTRYGYYEYTVVPVVLSNRPASFMKSVNDTFTDYIRKFSRVYLDEILTYNNSWKSAKNISNSSWNDFVNTSYTLSWLNVSL